MIRLICFYMGAVILLGMACVFQTNVELTAVLAIARLCSTAKGCANLAVNNLILIENIILFKNDLF